MAEKRRKFDPEFREGAVRIVRETGRPIAQLSRHPRTIDVTLTQRLDRGRQRRDSDAGARLSESEREELLRLRRENAELAMERDVLERSVVLWVKEATR